MNDGNALGRICLRGNETKTVAFLRSQTKDQLLSLVRECDTWCESVMALICFRAREDAFAVLVRELDAEVLQAMITTRGRDGYTAVAASARGGSTQIMKFLVGHPAIGLGPLLARDQSERGDRWLPIMLACLYNHLDLVLWMLATMPITSEVVSALRNDHLLRGFSGIGTIRETVRRYVQDPGLERRLLRAQLHLSDAPDLFALLVFLSDGFLEISGRERVPKASANSSRRRKRHLRFFRIAVRFPLELMMRVSHLATGSPDSCSAILTKDSEPAFRELARSLVA